MTFYAYPKPHGAVDNLLNIAEWQRMELAKTPDGVTSGFDVTPFATIIRVGAGMARIGGFAAYSDTSSDVPIPSAVGGRRDRLVLRMTWVGSTSDPTAITIAPVVKQGDGAGNLPTLAKTLAGTWELPLAHWLIIGTTVSNFQPDWWGPLPAVRGVDMFRAAVPATGDEYPGFGYALDLTFNSGQSTAPLFPATIGGNVLAIGQSGWYELAGYTTANPGTTAPGSVNVRTSSDGGSSWTTQIQCPHPAGVLYQPFSLPALALAEGTYVQLGVHRITDAAGNVGGRMAVTMLRAA